MSLFLYLLLGFIAYVYHRQSLLSVPVIWSGLLAVGLVNENLQPNLAFFLLGSSVLVVCNVLLFTKTLSSAPFDAEGKGLALTGCALGGAIAGQAISLIDYSAMVVALFSSASVLFVLLPTRLTQYINKIEQSILGSLLVNALFVLVLSDNIMLKNKLKGGYSLENYLTSLFLFLGMTIGLLTGIETVEAVIGSEFLLSAFAALTGVVLASLIRLVAKTSADRWVMDGAAVFFCVLILLKIFP